MLEFKDKWPNQDLMNALIHVGRLHKSIIDEKTAPIGLHRSQNTMLGCISLFPEAPNQKDVAEVLQISAASAAVTLKKLEELECIVRNPQKEDNRCNTLELSERGKDIVAKTHKIFAEVDEKTFAGLSDKELDCFKHCLEVMEDNLLSLSQKRYR